VKCVLINALIVLLVAVAPSSARADTVPCPDWAACEIEQTADGWSFISDSKTSEVDWLAALNVETRIGDQLILGPQGSECPFCIQAITPEKLADLVGSETTWAEAITVNGNTVGAGKTRVAAIDHGEGLFSVQTLLEFDDYDGALLLIHTDRDSVALELDQSGG